MRASNKKIISLILVFTLLFSMSYSAFAAAAEGFSDVSVTFTSDKKQYKSGEEIKLKTKIKNVTGQKQYVSVSYRATPFARFDDVEKYNVSYAEVENEADAEFLATAKATHSVFSTEWMQDIYDAVFGSFWSSVYLIMSMFNSRYEPISIKVDGVPAVILAKVDACLSLPEEPTEPTEPVVPTDPTDPTDTDNDGFTDYEEIYIMGTDPKEKNDLDADTDGDGLPDGDEVHKYKTDINSKDTDGDGLSDYDEIFVYHTDPLKDDTDGDGLSDKFEVDNKLDPTKTSTDGKTKDSEVKIEQTLSDLSISENLKDESNCAIPSISGLVNGEIDKNVFISTTTDCTVDDNRAIIGKPAYVDSKDEYINGLTLSFDISKYKGDKSTLSICIVNEDGTYDLVESESTDGEISCKLNEVGTYFVMDIEEFLKNLGVDLTEYKAPKKLMSRAASTTSDDKEVIISGEKVSGQADIVFAIDTTGSMSDEVENVILNITDFTNRLATQYNVKVNYALIDFKDLEEDGAGTTKVVKNGYSNWYSDTAPFIEKLKAIDIDGGGDSDECDIDALETARRLDWRASSSKFIILITDADYKVANDYGLTSMEEEVELLAKDGIVTSVVTDSSFEESYRSVYETTGGLYANIYANFSEVLLKLADLIGEETSDGEWVILKHGYRYIKLPELPERDSKTDTDKDGLTDAYELGETETIDLTPWIMAMLAMKGIPASEYIGKKTITVYNAVSDPSTNDTDNDGILDAEDTAPFAKGDKDGYIGTLTLVSCGSDSVFSIAANKITSGLIKASTGHAFLMYTSDVNDELNTKNFNRILYTESGSWKTSTNYGISTYKINRNKTITMGANGIEEWADEAPNDYGAYCSTINVESYKYYYGVDYQPNAGISKKVTQSDLDKLIIYFKGEATKNYSPFSHQCAHVATGAWKQLFNVKIDPIGMNTPKSIKKAIEKLGGKEINLKNYSMQEFIVA